MAQAHTYPQRRFAEPGLGTTEMAFRSGLFVVVLLCVWTQFNPFPNADQAVQITDVGSSITQIGYTTLFVILAAWCLTHQPLRLVLLIRPAMILALTWCALSVVTSWDPSLSMRRFMFALVTIGIAGMMLMVPKNARHFAQLMAAVALVLLVASYLGVVLRPSLAIHQASDIIEPELAGDWRGIFGHKNGASAAMVIFVFTGLMLHRLGDRWTGALVVVLALPFLWFTHSRTAIAELPLVLLISSLGAAVRNPVVGIALTVSIVLGLTMLTLGSMYAPSIHALVETLRLDPTFTGRTDIWKFVIGRIGEHPLTGFGFATFWNTEQVVYGMSQVGWASSAGTAHNGYLDLALTIGIPGSILVTLWLIVAPHIDFYRVPYAPANEPMRMFFFRVLLFAAFESCFESSFLQVGAFLLFLVAAGFGLRLMSKLRVSA